MMQYAAENRDFPYELYVQRGSARKCWRKFRHNIPVITVPSTTDVHETCNEVRSAVKSRQEIRKKKGRVLTEDKLDVRAQ
jgi:hypothetical protein